RKSNASTSTPAERPSASATCAYAPACSPSPCATTTTPLGSSDDQDQPRSAWPSGTGIVASRAGGFASGAIGRAPPGPGPRPVGGAWHALGRRARRRDELADLVDRQGRAERGREQPPSRLGFAARVGRDQGRQRRLILGPAEVADEERPAGCDQPNHLGQR